MRDLSREDQLRRTYDRLTAAGVRVIGAVLNGVSTNYYQRYYGSYEYIIGE